MVAKKTKSKKVKKSAKEEGIPFLDIKTQKVYLLKKKDFEEELEKIYSKISSTLSKFEKLGKYNLDEIDISLGVSGGFVVFSVKGGVTLRYKYKGKK